LGLRFFTFWFYRHMVKALNDVIGRVLWELTQSAYTVPFVSVKSKLDPFRMWNLCTDRWEFLVLCE
jgi:hypothetical protein